MPSTARCFGAVLAALCAASSWATDYIGAGGPIPEYSPDRPVSFSSSIAVGDAGTVRAITVSLTGLTHPFAGDLSVTLTHIDTGATQHLFHRVGAMLPGQGGDSSDFNGEYRFSDAFTGNLWVAAAGVGPAGAIPGGDYFATGPLSALPVSLLSAFESQSAAGTWVLTISDLRDPFVGAVGAWTLSLELGEPPPSCPPSDHDCATLGPPGCTDAACCDTVCAQSIACCQVQWDFGCILAAESACGVVVPCPSSTHDCFTAGAPGCTDLACCVSICDMYSGCCVLGWDAYCVSLASFSCTPPPPTCPPADHTCLSEGGPGCTDEDCCVVVCIQQPSCCSVAWDASCATIALLSCGFPYFACSSGDHSCFQFGEPGCNDPDCCLAVCDIDPPCCSFGWDQGCIDAAFTLCGGGPPGGGVLAAAFHATPADWMEVPVQWIRDTEPVDSIAPLNKIDVLIDGSNELLFDIVVNFRRCPQPEDIAALLAAAPTAQIQRIGRYITFVLMAGVPKDAIAQIVGSPWVAFVEKQVLFKALVNTSTRAIKVRSSPIYSPLTVEDIFPTLAGNGVNVVIMDTGVDNTLHKAFAATPFIGGYNAIGQSFGDPDDDNGHGTHVASIALGQSFNPMPFVADAGRGVAPAAGLIDIKVLDGNGFGTFAGLVDGLEIVYDTRESWSIDVVNMSIGAAVPSDGKDAICELVNLAEAMKIVVVVAAGNEGPNNAVLGVPASATRAITVAAADDRGTIFRDDDGVAAFSNRGPRSDDKNGSAFDELKPEIAAPGVHITAALHNSMEGAEILSGTSMAAPHVAGVVALIKELFSDINGASVRCLLIDSATPLPGYGPTQPAVDPTWNEAAGWGLLDGAGVFLAGPLQDMGFPSYPASPAWLSPDLSTTPFPPKTGQPAVIEAKIWSNGAEPSQNVIVEFGVHNFTGASDTFFNVGTKRVTLAPGLNTVSMDWTPKSDGHRCLQVDIGYCRDTWFANNTAQRNIEVTMSPVTFEIGNTLSVEPKLIEFDVAIADPGWTVELAPSFVVLGGDDCPVQVVALPHPPLGAIDGASTTIHIGARIGNAPLDGVTILAIKEDCNGNGEDDYFDILNGTSQDLDGNGDPDECDAPCDADLNHDGAVDGADLGLLLSGWGGGGSSDVDGSGVTDGGDLGLVLAAWGACR